MTQENNKTASQKGKKNPRGFLLGRSIKGKLLFWLLIISLLPIPVIGFVVYERSAESLQTLSSANLETTLDFQKKALEDYFEERSKSLDTLMREVDQMQHASFSKMEAIKKIKKQQIENLFNQQLQDVQLFSQSPQQKQLFNYYKAGNLKVGLDKLNNFFNSFTTIKNFDSLVITDNNSKVIFSNDATVKVGILLNELAEGPEKEAYSKGTVNLSFTDYSPSPIRDDEYAAFFSSPIKINEETVGVAIIKLKDNLLDEIMAEYSGLGETGDNYLVNKDGLFISNSRLIDVPTKLEPAFIVETEATTAAIQGISDGMLLISFTGHYVLSSYIPISIMDTTWALIVEQKLVETLAPKIHEVDEEGVEGLDHLATVSAEYGYPDLYVIGVNGSIIYSTQRKVDYGTNIINGPYKDSLLSSTVEEVIETNDLVVSDYGRYEPNDLKPTMFMAQPLLDDEEVIMILVLQLPIDQISSVMEKHRGSGKVSDSYLIGQDQQWRSESLRTEKYNVTSTLLNPKTKIDTEPVTKALAGNTDTQITVNGLGENVLTSWAPFTFNKINWAIISEVSQAEVNKPAAGLLKFIAFIAGLALVVLIVINLLVSNGIIRQTGAIMTVIGEVEKGNYEERVKITSNDELGDMADSFNEMIEETQTLIKERQEEHAHLQKSIITLLEEITNLADGDLSVRASVRDDATGTLADALNMMLEELGEAIGTIKEMSEQVGTTANQLSSSTQELSTRSDAQAKIINESTKEINQMSLVIEQSSKNAEQSATTSQLSSQAAEEGAQAVADTSLAMEVIRGNVQDTAKAIKRLGESSQEISDFAKTINEISDRTSILALNASIQAAAAGEEGQGFAVVAEEIQRLAEQTATSTKQIETLIKNILGDITEAGSSMDTSIQEVINGTTLSENAFAKLEDITQHTKEAAELSTVVAAASRNQAESSALLVNTMDEIGSISSESSEFTRQTSSSMQQMADMADEMLKSVAAFTLERQEEIEEENDHES